MLRTFQGYAGDMPDICREYAKDMLGMWLRYAQGIHKICPIRKPSLRHSHFAASPAPRVGDCSAKGSHPVKKSVSVLILSTGGGGSCPNPNLFMELFLFLVFRHFSWEEGDHKTGTCLQEFTFCRVSPKIYKKSNYSLKKENYLFYTLHMKTMN